MGLLYPPPLLVPPYLPSINATAGASCNNTCTSEPPARERETGERGAGGRGRTGEMRAEENKNMEVGERRKKNKTIKTAMGWCDGP